MFRREHVQGVELKPRERRSLVLKSTVSQFEGSGCHRALKSYSSACEHVQSDPAVYDNHGEACVNGVACWSGQRLSFKVQSVTEVAVRWTRSRDEKCTTCPQPPYPTHLPESMQMIPQRSLLPFVPHETVLRWRCQRLITISSCLMKSFLRNSLL